MNSLRCSPFFSVLADECQDISTQKEQSICCRWLVNGCPEEHFLTVLYVKSTDAETISATITSFISENNLDCRRVVGQGYNGAATFSGSQTGVQWRIRVHAAHVLFIHCYCHRLQLASIEATESVGAIKMFSMMASQWKLLYYSLRNGSSEACAVCSGLTRAEGRQT